MAWDVNKPQDSVKIRNLPSDIRANFEAISTADTSLEQKGVNLEVQGANLSDLTDAYRLFAKDDASGNSQLFGINDNSVVNQLSGWAFKQNANGYLLVPGGILIKWGQANVNSNTAITFDSTVAFSSVYAVVAVRAGATVDANGTPLATGSITNANFKVFYTTTGPIDIQYIAIGIQ